MCRKMCIDMCIDMCMHAHRHVCRHVPAEFALTQAAANLGLSEKNKNQFKRKCLFSFESARPQTAVRKYYHTSIRMPARVDVSEAH